MNAPLSHREQSDRYHGEIFRQDGLRVILCKDGIQWILQRQDKLAGARWRALGYYATRAALIHLWTGLKRDIPPELATLRDTARGDRNG